MAKVYIDVNVYDSFADIDHADAYLAADVTRAALWGALGEDDKGRALVTATRLLLRQSWIDGTPSLETPPDVVKDAAALIAADVVAKPAVADGANGSNVKAVGAGSARVEFFRPVEGAPLPPAAFLLLRDLLGSGSSASDPALDNIAYGSEGCRPSRFPLNDDLPRYWDYEREGIWW